MHEEKSTGTSEMKAFGQDLLDLGVRYMKAGKAWLNYRRNEMNHDNDHGGNRRQNEQGHRKQQVPQWRTSGQNEQGEQEPYGQYRGSDYSDPRRGGDDSDFGAGRQSSQPGNAATEHSSRYSESGAYREQDQSSRNRYSQGRQHHDAGGRDGYRNMDGQSQNTGGHGGYADEQDAGRRNQSGSRRIAQDQYGDPRGSGDGAQGHDGQQARAGSGQSHYGNSTQGGYRQFGQNDASAGASGSRTGHRGKGPRSYSRSDERLTEDLNEQLMHDDDIDASDISVRVEKGEVTLEGTVTERWMKHRAEDLAERCSGVNDVDNRIRVKKSGADASDGNPSSSMKSSGGDTGGRYDGSNTKAPEAGAGGGTASANRASGKTT